MKHNVIGLTLTIFCLVIGIGVAGEPGSTIFTHVARIPADSDQSTIRFERAKIVKVPTRITYTTNTPYCAELAFRDPGGSMSCPGIATGSPATADEVTYSYIGQPLASDEFGDRNFTFQVYLRPDELAPRVRQELMEKKNRADLAGYFEVSTVREPVRRIVIEEAKSHFCDGNFVDGTWTHSDTNCQDEIHTAAIAVPSGYLTVIVEPIAGLSARVMTESR